MPDSPQIRESLFHDLWRACDILRRDNNCGGVLEYIEHLAWLLFLRFLDAQEEEWEAQAQMEGKPYSPILDEPYRWSSWATKDWPAEDLLKFVHGELIPYLQNLSGEPPRDTIRSIFSERNVIVCASGYNLKEILSILNSIDFLSQDDIFTVSQVYDELLRRLGHENKVAGEFYTPRPVVRFIIELIDPKIGETIYDPACGTAGFLVEAFLWMKKKEKTLQDYERLQEGTFWGHEKKPVPALLGLMNLVLQGLIRPNIFRKNTLEESAQGGERRYDVILTNPPFGGKEGQHIQRNFRVQVQATELLFLQHIMHRLKREPGARCGMVVPEGLLFRGDAFALVKKELLEDFNLHTVVSLPPGTFAPYSDVKTALLFFEWPGPTKEIWYYELPLPEGLKKFSKGSPIRDEHFAEARGLWRAWAAYRQGHAPREACLSERSWIVPVEEIRARGYDLTARNPNRKDTEALPPPTELLGSLLEQERQIMDLLRELEALLSPTESPLPA